MMRYVSSSGTSPVVPGDTRRWSVGREGAEGSTKEESEKRGRLL